MIIINSMLSSVESYRCIVIFWKQRFGRDTLKSVERYRCIVIFCKQQPVCDSL